MKYLLRLSRSRRRSGYVSDTEPCCETILTLLVVQVGFAVLYCLLSAGIVFGYAAIKPVLIAEGIYRSECTKQELEDPTLRVCYKQELR